MLTIDDYRADLAMYRRDLRRSFALRNHRAKSGRGKTVMRAKVRFCLAMVRSLRKFDQPRQLDLFS